jgi:adenine phosphoribosyltransferase
MSPRHLIRAIDGFPKPGVRFRDITPLLADPAGFNEVIARMVAPWRDVQKVAAIEARGFIFGAAIARALEVGFIPVRKPGKLPADVVGLDYQLEYGSSRLELHRDAIAPGERVLIVDDLLATGGTALAALTLLRGAGAHVVGCSFAIDLPFLGGGDRLRKADVAISSVFQFDGDE